MLNHSFNIKFRHLSLGVAPREAALTQLLCWLCPASVFLDCFTDWVPVGDGGGDTSLVSDLNVCVH